MDCCCEDKPKNSESYHENTEASVCVANPRLLYLHYFCTKYLVCNGDFEEINLIYFGKASINGQVVELNQKDTSFLWQQMDKRWVKVSANYWNFATPENPIYSGMYSNVSKAKSGNVCGEITPFIPNSKHSYFVSNIAGQLNQSLQKGCAYQLSFWLRQEEGNYPVQKIGVAFSSEKHPYSGYVYKGKKRLDPVTRQKIYSPYIIKNNIDVPILRSDTSQYQYIEVSYVAQGGEKYIYIGNLSYQYPKKYNKRKLRKKNTKYNVPYCQYLIDDVNLLAISNCHQEVTRDTLPKLSNDITIPVELEKKEKLQILESIIVAKEKSILLDEFFFVHFKSNSAIIDDAHFEEKIYTLSQTLQLKNNKYTIEITGHADSDGTARYNLELSQNRAEVVKQLFVKQGISSKLIYTKGVGENEPLKPNISEGNKRMNRRVKIVIKNNQI